ncbi:MAG: hypothetical protein ACWGOV_07855 [Acidiferrobacterales bacterium]
MAGFLAGLGLRIYGSSQTTHYIGPGHMVSGSGKVYISANGNLFVLTNIGDLLLQLTGEQLDIQGDVTDLRMMPDGRLLIAERRPARIRLCDSTTWVCQPVKVPHLERTLENQFKVLPDPDGNTLYVTDSTRKGPLYKIDIAAGTIVPILEGVLSYANDIQWSPDGLLWVADSGHHRIVQLKLKDGRAQLTGVPFSAKNRVSYENRTWPMMLQYLPSGEWAVTQPTSHGGQADILIYKDAQTPERRLQLDDRLDPTDLVVANGWLVASDIEGYALYSIDTNTGASQRWGDVNINDWLNEQKSERRSFQRWIDGGMVIMILTAPFMLLGAYLGTPKSQRDAILHAGRIVRLHPSAATIPLMESIYWLKRRPKMDRVIRFLAPAATVLMLLLIGALGFVLHLLSDTIPPEKQSELLRVFLVVAVVAIGMLPIIYLNMRMVRGQLGTDGLRVFVRYPNGDQGSAPINQIVYSANLLRFGQHTVSVGARQRQALYEPGEIETYIAPLLREGKKVNAFGMAWRQILSGEPGPIYTYVYLVVLIALAIYLKIFT